MTEDFAPTTAVAFFLVSGILMGVFLGLALARYLMTIGVF